MLPGAVRPFVGFASVLRINGFAVAPEQTISFLEAVRLLGPHSMQDIYRAARALFAIPKEREPEFDALFRAHFLGQTVAAPAEGEEQDEVEAHEETPAATEAELSDEEAMPGMEAVRAERLSRRDLSPGETDAVLREFVRLAPASLPRRVSYRRTRAHRGDRPDMRRVLREMVRRDGDVTELPRTRRKTRQRRLVMLVDVSGSMSERTDGSLAFAHSLVRVSDRAEVFTLGTRLTRVTPGLRTGDRERALERVSQVVADIDGGTRIGDALQAFLAVPRYAGLARGAAVVVLSDGLERGAPAEMTDAVARLSRLAWRLDWLSPLADAPGFVPKTEALSAVLPWLDKLSDGSRIDRVAEHFLNLARPA